MFFLLFLLLLLFLFFLSVLKILVGLQEFQKREVLCHQRRREVGVVDLLDEDDDGGGGDLGRLFLTIRRVCLDHDDGGGGGVFAWTY